MIFYYDLIIFHISFYCYLASYNLYLFLSQDENTNINNFLLKKKDKMQLELWSVKLVFEAFMIFLLIILTEKTRILWGKILQKIEL